MSKSPADDDSREDRYPSQYCGAVVRITAAKKGWYPQNIPVNGDNSEIAASTSLGSRGKGG